VSFIAALLAVEVYAGVARIVRRILLLIFTLKALQAGASFQQRSVHSEVFVAGQVLFLRLLEYFTQKFPRYLAFPTAGSGSS